MLSVVEGLTPVGSKALREAPQERMRRGDSRRAHGTQPWNGTQCNRISRFSGMEPREPADFIFV